VIAGIGGHGNLRPLTSQIISFFLVNLAHSDATPILPPPPAPGTSPSAAPNVPAGAMQVTPTGQVATSYPGSETVHTLTLKRAAQIIPIPVKPQTLLQVQTDIREVTNAEAAPGALELGNMSHQSPSYAGLPSDGLRVGIRDVDSTVLHLPCDPGISLPFNVVTPQGVPPRRLPAVVLLATALPYLSELDLLRDGLRSGERSDAAADKLALAGKVVLAFTPRPSPPGSEETKSPILGPFYTTELRAELVGKTLLGMRVDDVIRAVGYLASRPDVDPDNITAEASGHMGLVLLQAAVRDPRIKHITVDHVLESYRSLLEAPMPLDAPQDILPGVLLKYDIPDLVRVLGPRLTATDWLHGSANLAAQ
jgi:hypothetical protein